MLYNKPECHPAQKSYYYRPCMDNKNPNYVMAQCGNYGTLNLQLKLVNGLSSLLTTHVVAFHALQYMPHSPMHTHIHKLMAGAAMYEV